MVFEGLQSVDIRAQFTAANAVRFSFHQSFAVMIKDAATDVLSVSQYIQEAGEFLTNTSTNRAFAMSVLEGDAKCFEETFPSPDVKCPVVLNLFSLLRKLPADCLQEGCQKAAAGLHKISA